MKMQIAYLPGNKWMLVLSEVDIKGPLPDSQAVKFMGQTGATAVYVTDQPVELEGEIAYEKTELEPAVEIQKFEKTDLQPYLEELNLQVEALAKAPERRPSAENRSWTGEI